ncbi:hypothetical protein HA49_04355 [Tatumella morbirosei]|uniref:Uncharacterized protein n=1 Tax=Tatumella morbirosei TaxID=642227 RepID=A0A095VQ10_9GAMM|nr:hypothetical protein [Tatumella morbirosei]KGD76725.1 hypothetical protein HA49_04355 [Tatumella morbirosei]
MRYRSDSQSAPATGWVPNVPGGQMISSLARPLPAGQPVELSPAILAEPAGIGSSLTHIRLSAVCAAFDRD